MIPTKISFDLVGPDSWAVLVPLGVVSEEIQLDRVKKVRVPVLDRSNDVGLVSRTTRARARPGPYSHLAIDHENLRLDGDQRARLRGFGLAPMPILQSAAMRLLKVEVRGIRRFADPTVLWTDGKLTAVVGPNEAGKTTLLEALAHLEDAESFLSPETGSPVVSRSKTPEAGDKVVEALFGLEDSDRALVSDLPGSESLRSLSIYRTADGTLFKSVAPPLYRDLRPRKAAVDELQRIPKSRWLKSLDSESRAAIMIELDACLSVLDSEDETLSDTGIAGIQDLIDLFDEHSDESMPKYVKRLSERLHQLGPIEEADLPSTLAAATLWGASPDFLMFRDEDRLLYSEYSLSAVFSSPPGALKNLVNLAALDLAALKQAQDAQNHGLVETITDAANTTLAIAMAKAWQQSKVEVRFTLSEDILRIMVQTDGSGFFEIADRSDGLRAFVALVAFATKRERDVILLIDEAEAHLHYDAQADLIQMLGRQTIARQVIYTTHSAGCLPEDLTSVRTVEPIKDSDRSIIRNWFWEGRPPGFAPLLTGMGAATMAFVPTRFAVIVEGAADLVLLPTLFREASNQEWLGFQIAPGLANAAQSEIPALDREAPHILYVMDNDDGGDGILSKLAARGIEDSRCFRVSRSRGSVLEDLLDETAYLSAVNGELRQSGSSSVITALDLTTSNRPLSISSWCTDSGRSVPSKRAVAQRLLVQARDGTSLLSSSGSAELAHLLKQITSAFNLTEQNT